MQPKTLNTFSWILKIIAALIMLQTLYFKFTGAPESVYIFSTLGLEPYGRIGTGIAELLASILLLIPSTAAFGALLGAGIMGGAIVSHIFKLGIEVQNDGGQLFVYALIVLICCSIVLFLNKAQLLKFIKPN